MAQNTIERTIAENQSFSDGDQTIDLPRSHYYLMLNVVVDWDITVDNVAAAKTGNGVLDIVDRLEVTANGSQTVKSVSFALSHLVDRYVYGTSPLSGSLDYGTASQQTGTIQTFLDFRFGPGDLSAMLPSFEASDLTLDIEWGSASDIEDGGDHITINSVDAHVESVERLRKSVSTDRETERSVLGNLMVFKEREKTVTLSSAGETPVELPTGNIYHSVPFQIIDNDVPDNALVDSFEVVEDGVETHRAVSYDRARAKDKVQYGIESLPDGFVYVNFGFRDDLDDVVSSAGMDQWELVLDTDGTSPTATSEARVVTQEIIR